MYLPPLEQWHPRGSLAGSLARWLAGKMAWTGLSREKKSGSGQAFRRIPRKLHHPTGLLAPLGKPSAKKSTIPHRIPGIPAQSPAQSRALRLPSPCPFSASFPHFILLHPSCRPGPGRGHTPRTPHPVSKSAGLPQDCPSTFVATAACPRPFQLSSIFACSHPGSCFRPFQSSRAVILPPVSLSITTDHAWRAHPN